MFKKGLQLLRKENSTMHEAMVTRNTALSRVHFTKEFPGFEIESKWTLLTQNPVPFLLKMRSDIQDGYWRNHEVAMSMGELAVGIRFFDLRFQFWGIEKSNKLEQVAMVACLPKTDKYQLAFKSKEEKSFSVLPSLSNPPLVRSESRTGAWITHEEVVEDILKVFPQAYVVGQTRREKCFVYLTDKTSRRNFCVSADICYCGSKTLSQVEIEYKGRCGCCLPDTTGVQIMQDFGTIHSILEEYYGSVLAPTKQTKFEWIADN